MQAVIVSADKLSTEILQSILAARAFAGSSISVRLPASMQLVGEDFSSAVIFLDLDAPEAQDALLRFAPDVRIVSFGSAATRKKLRGSLEERFILKPFTRERVEAVMADVLVSSVHLPATSQTPALTDAAAAAALLQDWNTLAADISRERQRVIGLLKATPDQLKALLIAGPPAADDMTRISVATLPLRTVLIAEPDRGVAEAVSRFLAKKCVLAADICTDGKEAWSKLCTADYDAVVMSWELEVLSGLALYNRMRMTARLRHVPVVVLSGQLSHKDFRLLDEDMAAVLVAKPIQERLFHAELTRAAAAAVVARQYRERLFKTVASALSSGVQLRSGSGLADDELLLQGLKLAGDHHLRLGQPADALQAFAAAWHLGDRRLSLVTGYAKACFLTGRTEEAHRLLLTADMLAPQSVERLCLIGELDLTLQAPAAANAKFTQALQIDPDVLKAQAGQHVAATILEQGLAPPSQGLPADQFSSYLNMVGISLSRSQQLAKALTYYKSALHFVRENDKRAKVWFNVGICHLRGHEAEAAQAAFGTAFKLSDGKLHKAGKYLDGASGPLELAVVGGPLGTVQDDDEDLFERI